MPDFVKDPDAILDYAFDWSDDREGPWLDDGETITSSTWSISPSTTPALTVNTDSLSGQETVVWLEGGEVGTEYTVTNHIVTDSSPVNREEDRSFTVIIQER